ncbi:MAG: diaminopimelate epimerase [Bacteroidales bacterium]|nr:diaminopimelate epimerase [Bacteroidales bacterium]MBN2633457.1 diaminopimelate epimerase [Bacteroidales bacterium]
MKITFNKYQGAGNDFIMIDNRNAIINPEDSILINRMCDRRFGIGADGLILISDHDGADFEMKYFNSDGKLGSMCGNGGRCTAHFALKHGIAGELQKFMAFDGIHEAEVNGDTVRLQMADVNGFQIIEGNYFINTGSPHYMVFTSEIDSINVNEEGKNLRWSPLFAPGGTNVNFVEVHDNGLYIRTFERGVEEETLACGTGVTASAIAAVLKGHFDTGTVSVKARGGNLKVELDLNDQTITNIWLTGPATFVYEGSWEL